MARRALLLAAAAAIVLTVCASASPWATPPRPSIPRNYHATFTTNKVVHGHGLTGDLLQSSDLMRRRIAVSVGNVTVSTTITDTRLQHQFNVSASTGNECDVTWTDDTSPDGILGWASPQAALVFVGVDKVQGVACNAWEDDSGTLRLCVRADNPSAAVQFQSPFAVLNFSSFTAEDIPASALALPPQCTYSGVPSPPFGLRDTFDGDALADLWLPGGDAWQRYVVGHITLQQDIVRAGRGAANITCYKGDIDEHDGTERDELDSRSWHVLGQDVYYGWSQYFPVGFEKTDNRLVFGQLKQSNLGESHPVLAQRYQNDEWYWTVQPDNATKHSFPVGKPLQRGVWHDVVVHAVFSRNTTGAFQVWLNGTQAVNYSGRTAWETQGSDFFYFKLGIYRDTWPTPWTAYIDSFAIGRSFDEVNPARDDPLALL